MSECPAGCIRYDQIHIDTGSRRPADPVKVAELAESIKLVGLLNPVVVTEQYGLVAGLHRYHALVGLGETYIPVRVVQLDSLQAELAMIDENLRRNDLTVLEQAQALKRRNELLEEWGLRRTVGGNGSNQHESNGVTVTPLLTTADIASQAGMSANSLQKRLQIANGITDAVQELIRDLPIADSTTDLLLLARMAPSEQQEVARVLHAGDVEKVSEARRLVVKDDHTPSAPIEGQYRVFYADPPWEYGNAGIIGDQDNYGHVHRHYQSMSLDQLCAMGEQIKASCEKDAVLFLWATSPLLRDALALVDAWGFTYKTSFVWDKVKHNFGHYNSVRHEVLLVCTRGSCTPDHLKLFDSVQSIERSDKHSEKPEEFRQIIDTLYTHGNRIELFARKRVDGWDAWGNQVDTSVQQSIPAAMEEASFAMPGILAPATESSQLLLS